MITFARSICFGLLLGILFLVPLPVGATIMYDVSFNDQFGTFSAFYAPIQSHLLAAGADWARSIAGDTTLQIEVQFADSINRSFGRSATNAPIGSQDGRTVLQEGAAFKIATGMDVNGPSNADIIIGFQPNYLLNTLWFDPNPFARTAPVPSDKTDAMSVVLHELGHAFAFNGFRNLATGELPSTFESVYDSHIVFRNGIPFFVGSLAGEVALTFDSRLTQNIYHLGNIPPGPGSDLIDDLMNGIEFTNGR